MMLKRLFMLAGMFSVSLFPMLQKTQFQPVSPLFLL